MRVAAVLTLFVVCAACSDKAKPAVAPLSSASSSAAPACARPHPSGQSSEAFEFQGHSRTYELYVPPVYDGAREVPVVFDFHGFGSNAKQQIVYGNFKPEADHDDFLIVAPDGQGGAAGQHFNLTAETGLQDDLAMTSALLDHIEATLCVDTQRVYA